jgi:hypothetical protein
VNTDGTKTDSDSAQKALRKDIESDIAHGQDFGTRPSSPSQTEGILKQNLSRTRNDATAPARNSSVEHMHQRRVSSICHICNEKPEFRRMICSGCSLVTCLTCATITDDVVMAAKPFLDPGTEWLNLLCVKCQGDNLLDDDIHKCLINVQEAIRISLEQCSRIRTKTKAKHSGIKQACSWSMDYHFRG